MHLGKLGIITLLLYVRTLKVRLYKYHAQGYLASKRQNVASVWVCFGRTQLFLLPCIEELRQWGLSSDVPTQAGLFSAGWRLGFLCSSLDRLCLLHLHCRFLVLTQEGRGAEGLFSLLILRHSLWLGSSKLRTTAHRVGKRDLFVRCSGFAGLIVKYAIV